MNAKHPSHCQQGSIALEKAQQVNKADQESINTEIHEASDYRYGIAKRSGAQAIWLKDE